MLFFFLRHIASKILEERYEGHDVQWNWIEERSCSSDYKEFQVVEYVEERTEEYSDGSKLEGAAAAATSRSAITILGSTCDCNGCRIGRDACGVTRRICPHCTRQTRSDTEDGSAIHRAVGITLALCKRE